MNNVTRDAPTMRLAQLAASWVFVALSTLLYGLAPYNHAQLAHLFGSPTFHFTGLQFLIAASACYAFVLAIYHLGFHHPGESESLRCVRALRSFFRSPSFALRQGLPSEDLLAMRATLLKVYFAPMMAMSLMAFSMSAIENGSQIFRGDALAPGFKPLFDHHGFWFVMQLILIIDTLMFTVGYLVALPQLGNSIRSVDRTFLGWAVAVLCYPPFNELSGAILGSQRSDFPQFEDATAHLVLNCLLLTLMAVYASASVALGFKASNLTHRGIVARGPYAVIRHPAYVCKNMAWWIGASPLVAEAFNRSTFEGIQAVASVAGWTALYVLRALTEEDHLRSVDSEYAAYAGRVRFRFIPGVV